MHKTLALSLALLSSTAFGVGPERPANIQVLSDIVPVNINANRVNIEPQPANTTVTYKNEHGSAGQTFQTALISSIAGALGQASVMWLVNYFSRNDAPARSENEEAAYQAIALDKTAEAQARATLKLESMQNQIDKYCATCENKEECEAMRKAYGQLLAQNLVSNLRQATN